MVDLTFFDATGMVNVAGNAGSGGGKVSCWLSGTWKAELEVMVDVARGLRRLLPLEVAAYCVSGASTLETGAGSTTLGVSSDGRFDRVLTAVRRKWSNCLSVKSFNSL